MFKALLKKQLLEVNSYLFQNRKTGKLRDKKGVIGWLLVYAAIFIYIGASCFLSIGTLLCKPLVEAGFAWLYFALVSLLSIAVGIFGSVFNTYASLYRAKDNDLLLSMPIPPVKILSVRIIAVFTSSLIYESIIYIPALIARFIYAPVTFWGVAFSVLLWPILGALITFFTLILGWVVAIISSRLKNKTLVTVVLFLALFALYYVVIMKASTYMTGIVAASEEIGNAFRSWVYPVYAFGLAAEGNALAFFGFTLSVLALLGIAVYIMGRTFFSITTGAKTQNKVKYKNQTVKVKTASRALLSREAKRLFTNAMVFLNCAFSLIFGFFGGIAVLIGSSAINDAFVSFGSGAETLKSILLIIGIVSIFALSALNNIGGPFVSLEAKSLDLTRSLPVKSKDILLAKEKLHILITVFAVLFFAVSFSLAFGVDIVTAIVLCVDSLIFVFWGAAFSLAMGLKFPNLKWTNETVAVKQGAGNMIVALGGIGIALLVGGVSYLLGLLMPTAVAFAIIGAIFVGLTVILNLWIYSKGVEIFEGL